MGWQRNVAHPPCGAEKGGVGGERMFLYKQETVVRHWAEGHGTLPNQGIRKAAAHLTTGMPAITR